MDARRSGDGETVSAADARDLLRAVHALHDERRTLAERLGALARDLAVLTGSRQCVIGEVDANGGGWPLRLTPRGVFADMSADDVRHVMRCFEDVAATDTLAMRVLESPHKSGAVTMSAHRAFGPEVWRSGRLCSVYLIPSGLDDLLHSRAGVEVRARCFGWIGLGRPAGGPGFTGREEAIVNMLHAEVGAWLWTRIAGEAAETHNHLDANQAYQDLLGRLSPAQLRVLPLLVRGLTEDAIGVKLNRSRHTVHDHAKSIYAAAGVRSRLELILRVMGGDASEVAGAGGTGEEEHE